MGMVVGYKLIEVATNRVVQEWGGTWGECPGVPNPATLPNGDIVCGPAINIDYAGYMLVPWEMNDPGPVVPQSITPRQCRLLLLQQGQLASVEAMIASSTEDVRITWEYALEFNRNDPLLNSLATGMGWTTQEIDSFFIAASAL